MADEVVEATEAESLEAQAKDLEASAVEARAAADAAKAEAAAAREAEEAAKVDPTKHVFVDHGGGSFVRVEFPPDAETDPKTGYCRARRLDLGGRNVEHVGDRTYVDGDGKTQNVWVYRAM